MTATVALSVTVGDQQVHISEAAWFEVAACGCARSVIALDGPAGLLLSATEAFRALERNPETRRRAQVRGDHAVLGLRNEAPTRLVATCPHVPAWGDPANAIPKDWSWAADSGSTRRHLIHASSDHETDFLLPVVDGEQPSAASLCGKATSARWSAHWSYRDLPTCRACERAAMSLGLGS